jgi:hypothetical protein
MGRFSKIMMFIIIIIIIDEKINQLLWFVRPIPHQSVFGLFLWMRSLCDAKRPVVDHHHSNWRLQNSSFVDIKITSFDPYNKQTTEHQ